MAYIVATIKALQTDMNLILSSTRGRDLASTRNHVGGYINHHVIVDNGTVINLGHVTIKRMATVAKVHHPRRANTALPPGAVSSVVLGVLAAILVECLAQNVKKLALFRRVTELVAGCHDIDHVTLVKVLDVLDATHDIDVVNEHRVGLVRAHDTTLHRRGRHDTQTLRILDATRRHHQLLLGRRHRVRIGRVNHRLLHQLVGNSRLHLGARHGHTRERHARVTTVRVRLIVTSRLEHRHHQLDQVLATVDTLGSLDKLTPRRHVGRHLTDQRAQTRDRRLLVRIRLANLHLERRLRAHTTTQTCQKNVQRLSAVIHAR